jgi:hypothetical protein
MPVRSPLLPSEVAQFFTFHSGEYDEPEEQAVRPAVAAHLYVYQCAMTDNAVTRLKAAWARTEYVTWPLPALLGCARLDPERFEAGPATCADNGDDDVPF